MDKEIIQRISLEFNEEDKKEVLKILQKLFGKYSPELLTNDKDYLLIEMNYKDLEEKDFEELKEICDNIGLSEYEYVEYEGFFWEREDDNLQETMRKKLRQIKNEKKR